MSCNVSKVVLCGRRNTFTTFSEDALQFPWQAQHPGRVHCHFAWQAQHFRRSCCVFFQIGLAGLLQAATRCRFRLERNIDFEVANLEVPKKTPRKTSILRLQSVKVGGSLARNARFAAPTCLVSSLWFSCGLAVSMGKLQHLSFSKVFKQVVMSFCVAGVALCDIPTCFIHSRLLYTPHFTLSTLHFTLYTPHFALYTPHSTLHTPHFTLHTLHSTVLTLHSTLRTPHSTLPTPHSTLYILHSTLRTLHFTLYTLHSTLHTPHACRRKNTSWEEHLSCTNRQDTFMQTNMDVIARWIRTITVGKGWHFLTPWPMA